MFLITYFTPFDLWDYKPPHAPILTVWEDTATLPLNVKRYVLRFRILNRYVDYAEATIKGVARTSFDSLVLDFYGYGVDSVKLGSSVATFSRDTGSLTIRFPSSVASGDSVSVTIFYHGDPDSVSCPSFSGGIYTRSDGSFYTLSYPEGFRCWVPSLDRPYEKADSGVEFFVETDTSFTVVANGLLLDTVSTGSTRVWHYVHSHPIATYLISMAGKVLAANTWTWNYGSVSMPVLAWVSPSDTSYHWGDSLTAMLTYFSDLFGVYPFADEKYEQSVTMGTFSGGMEHQTSSSFSSLFGYSIQAHELCHQWWGDDVGYGTFKDIWLGEGFAVYCEMLWAEHGGGLSAYRSYYTSSVERVFFRYASNPGLPVYDPGPSINDILSVYTYNKGAAVLHMLRYVLDKDTSLFFGALRFYRSRHEGSYALTSDFVNDVQTYTGRDLRWFFDQWVYQPGWPVYNVRWNSYLDSTGEWVAVLVAEQTQPSGAPTFKMPVEIRWYSDSLDTTFTVWDSLNVQSFELRWRYPPDSLAWDPDNWILDQHTVTRDTTLDVSEIRPRSVRGIVVSVSGRKVSVLTCRGKTVKLYDRSGRLIAEGDSEIGIFLRAGVYYAVSGSDVKVFVVK